MYYEEDENGMIYEEKENGETKMRLGIFSDGAKCYLRISDWGCRFYTIEKGSIDVGMADDIDEEPRAMIEHYMEGTRTQYTGNMV